MNLLLPKALLAWIDENRGDDSRQVFIINCLMALKRMGKANLLTTPDEGVKR